MTDLRQAEPCVGKDPRCPCQDGDACHYKDCGSTNALPVAQPAQEPVAKLFGTLPVFDTPPTAKRPWVGLTDEDCLAALISVDSLTARLPIGFKLFARAIEAKLKEKNDH